MRNSTRPSLLAHRFNTDEQLVAARLAIKTPWLPTTGDHRKRKLTRAIDGKQLLLSDLLSSSFDANPQQPLACQSRRPSDLTLGGH